MKQGEFTKENITSTKVKEQREWSWDDFFDIDPANIFIEHALSNSELDICEARVSIAATFEDMDIEHTQEDVDNCARFAISFLRNECTA